MKTQYGYITLFGVYYGCGDFIESECVDFEDLQRIQNRSLRDHYNFSDEDLSEMKCQPYILIPADVALDDLLDTIQCLMQVARTKEKEQRQNNTADNTSKQTDTSDIANDSTDDIDKFFNDAVTFVKAGLAKMLKSFSNG